MNNRPKLVARTALAIAASAALSGVPLDASALGLGRLSVQSALGEGMLADIDIISPSPGEASSLSVRLAPPDAYRAAGVDYNAVLASARATVVRRPDGRVYVHLTSDRAVQEPFVEVILELNWASGRLVREYTLLFDPPGNRPAPPVQAAAPVGPMITMAPPVAQASTAPAPRPSPPPRPAPAPRAAPPAAAPAVQARPMQRSAQASEYEVQRGDTLYRIAGRNASGSVSLDQMLVGLYRANPDAFINDNINRLRAGAVLTVPSADAVRGITHAEARKLIVAQSADFGAYRNRLAQGAPQAATRAPSRQAKGKVQASVEDRKQTAEASPDKLELSSGPAKASAALAEAAQASARQDTTARVAELSRNVEALKQLQQGAAAAAASEPAASQPAAQAAEPAAQPASPAEPPAVAALPMAKPAPPPAPAPAPAPESGPGLIASLTGSSWFLPGAGVLALLLAGYGAWRLRGRLGKSEGETSFLESRMQPDSFFGASGGQRVDTRDAAGGASSMGYSLSQLDAIGDVDPVAEADVYLAYGRDLQAEEILKEAMRATPDRLAVRTKLLEVYAKRRDTKGFELLATQLYALTKGVGADWARAQELGAPIDPDNQLYQPGGHPEEIILDGERVVVEPLSATTLPHSQIDSPSTQPHPSTSPAGLPTMPAKLDLDLDLDLGTPSPPGVGESTRPIASAASRLPDAGLDFDFGDSTLPARRPGAGEERTVRAELDSLPPIADVEPKPPKSSADEPLSLDFGEFAATQRAPGADSPTSPDDLDLLQPLSTDPLARKLELAEEFRQIGDLEGARDLLNEVIGKAAGPLRSKAQSMLDALG